MSCHELPDAGEPGAWPRDAGGIRPEQAPGEADDFVAERLQLDIPCAVSFERLSAGVRAVAVELHYEPGLGPEKIDDEGANGDVDLRLGKAVPSAER